MLIVGDYKPQQIMPNLNGTSAQRQLVTRDTQSI
jgi:hypothetical protein